MTGILKMHGTCNYLPQTLQARMQLNMLSKMQTTSHNYWTSSGSGVLCYLITTWLIAYLFLYLSQNFEEEKKGEGADNDCFPFLLLLLQYFLAEGRQTCALISFHQALPLWDSFYENVEEAVVKKTRFSICMCFSFVSVTLEHLLDIRLQANKTKRLVQCT